MSEKLIMMIGTIGSGKTTAAEILAKYGFVVDNFASPLKQFARGIGFTHDQVYGTQTQKLAINKFWGISGRKFLQQFGSEVCRDALPKAIPNMNKNNRTLWARVIEQKITNSSLLVLGDGRFPDEAKLVKDYDGIIIRIVRGTNESGSTHVSELSISNIEEDYRIENNGTIEDLEITLCRILQAEGLSVMRTDDIKKNSTDICSNIIDECSDAINNLSITYNPNKTYIGQIIDVCYGISDRTLSLFSMFTTLVIWATMIEFINDINLKSSVVLLGSIQFTHNVFKAPMLIKIFMISGLIWYYVLHRFYTLPLPIQTSVLLF